MAVELLEDGQIKLKDILLQDEPEESFLDWLENSSPDGSNLRIAYEFADVFGYIQPGTESLLSVARRRKVVFDAELLAKQRIVSEPEEREF